MKQQVNPVMAIGAILGVLVVIGLVVYWINSKPEPIGAGAPPTAAGKSTEGANASGAAPTSTRNMAPDDVVKEHMKQMQQGGGK